MKKAAEGERTFVVLCLSQQICVAFITWKLMIDRYNIYIK